jgi:acetyltransferase-like isoleucine patch superfamily enzyme
MNSVATKDVPPTVTVFGVPGRIIWKGNWVLRERGL